MIIKENLIQEENQIHLAKHESQFKNLSSALQDEGVDVEKVMETVYQLQVATPSWALGKGGTRFGRFAIGGEPSTLEQKMEDVGVLRNLSCQTSSVSLHIPWDIPKDFQAIEQKSKELGVAFDSMNSNTFQDRNDFANAPRGYSYQFGSLCHSKEEVRSQAIEHNLECIEIGKKLGSDSLTVWLADGTTFPGQANFRHQFQNTLDSLQKIYQQLPADWHLFVEHKPYEPNFYSSVNNDWGSSLLLASKTGERCLCLVDLGHHLPNTNIEQVVSRVLMEERLAGFHFNDSKYGDDDLTVGSLKPYQLFLIFNELVEGLAQQKNKRKLAWMIDASHNVKDPLEDLLQSLDAISIAYAQALLIDQKKLLTAQLDNDVSQCQEILQQAYRTDVRPLLAEMRRRKGGAIRPIVAYRNLKVREKLIGERGQNSVATGL